MGVPRLVVALLEAEVVQANLVRAVVGTQVRVQGGEVAQGGVAQLLLAAVSGADLVDIDPADAISFDDVVASGKVE